MINRSTPTSTEDHYNLRARQHADVQAARGPFPSAGKHGTSTQNPRPPSCGWSRSGKPSMATGKSVQHVGGVSRSRRVSHLKHRVEVTQDVVDEATNFKVCCCDCRQDYALWGGKYLLSKAYL